MITRENRAERAYSSAASVRACLMQHSMLVAWRYENSSHDGDVTISTPQRAPQHEFHLRLPRSSVSHLSFKDDCSEVEYHQKTLPRRQSTRESKLFVASGHAWPINRKAPPVMMQLSWEHIFANKLSTQWDSVLISLLCLGATEIDSRWISKYMYFSLNFCGNALASINTALMFATIRNTHTTAHNRLTLWRVMRFN